MSRVVMTVLAVMVTVLSFPFPVFGQEPEAEESLAQVPASEVGESDCEMCLPEGHVLVPASILEQLPTREVVQTGTTSTNTRATGGNWLPFVMLVVVLALATAIIWLLLKKNKKEVPESQTMKESPGMADDGTVGFPLRVCFQQGRMVEFHVTEHDIQFRARRADKEDKDD